MERPKIVQNMITGSVGSMPPDAVNPRTSARFPSWKSQTSAPNDALIESRFMTTALIGSTNVVFSKPRGVL